MKRILILLALLLGTAAGLQAQIKIGGRKIDTRKAVQAAGDMAAAVTLSDEDIARMSREAVEWMDAHNPVDTAEYDARLKRLTAGIQRPAAELQSVLCRRHQCLRLRGRLDKGLCGTDGYDGRRRIDGHHRP